MKRTIIIISIILFIGIVVYGVVGFFDDPNQRPIRPIKSESNKILVTSNACCSMTYDFKLTLYDKQTKEKSVICTAEQVSEFDVFKYKMPKADVEEFEIILSCDVYYGETYQFENTIIEASDYNKFKDAGLLIYFQEADGMYINIITDTQHDTYKLMYDKDNVWELRDTPNEVFAEV